MGNAVTAQRFHTEEPPTEQRQLNVGEVVPPPRIERDL